MKSNINYGINEDVMVKRINVAGWGTRNFTLKEFEDYLYKHRPNVLELSKDFVEGDISIKKLFTLINRYKKDQNLTISYAGTTDFVNCSGLSFQEYLSYLEIQYSEAKFLKAEYFRLIIGNDKEFKIDLIERLKTFEEKIKPIKIIIEIHGGWESKIENIKQIINKTNFNFVIDFQNILESNLNFHILNKLIPENRIQYFHSRNLENRYVEDEISIKESALWINQFSNVPILWEPKLISKEEIIKCLN